MRVVVEGAIDERRVRHTWSLVDRTDDATGETSMARTTGFPCAIAVRLLAGGLWATPGIHPPESLGRDAELTRVLLSGLAGRGVRLDHRLEG